MARGKHAKSAALKEKRRNEEKAQSLRQRIEHERAERLRAEKQVAEAQSLIEEIEQLRRDLREQTAGEEAQLWEEIRQLGVQIAELEEEARRRSTSRTSDDAVLGALLYGPELLPHLNLSVEAIEAVLNETNRRMALAHPDAGYRTDQTITSGVADVARGKLRIEQIRALQRARGVR